MLDKTRNTILIADDSEMNRAILVDMLEGEYNILEAEDGKEAIAALKKYGTEISLLLLDIVMPDMDGYDVLAVMNHNQWIKDIPVIMITTEVGGTYLKRAYELGATDFINRPFDPQVAHCRIANTIMLYSKQKMLMETVAAQIFENEKNREIMISILSHIVEFRNGESGMHVLNVNTLTEILLRYLLTKTDKYPITQADISIIRMASSLHDIGKISIPEDILNKPGRLTREEFEIMKTHSMAGAELMSNLKNYQNEKLLEYSYQICRWHHERWDGGGYPDGLSGDDIPIAAQVVSMADVYDALTSVRCYKDAYSHETAINMILNGECGAFNPLLLECLKDAADKIKKEMNDDHSSDAGSFRAAQRVIEDVRNFDKDSSLHIYEMLSDERAKSRFLESLLGGISFEYDKGTDTLVLTESLAETLDVPTIITNPRKNEILTSWSENKGEKIIIEALKSTTPDSPTVSCDIPIKLKPKETEEMYRVNCFTIWHKRSNSLQYTRVVGELRPIKPRGEDITYDVG